METYTVHQDLAKTLPALQSQYFNSTTDLKFGNSSYLICPQKLSKQLKIVLFTLQGQKQRYQQKIQQLKLQNQKIQLEHNQLLQQKDNMINKLLKQLSELRISLDANQQKLLLKQSQIQLLKRKNHALKVKKNEQIQYLSIKLCQYIERNKKLTCIVLQARQHQKSIRSNICQKENYRNYEDSHSCYYQSKFNKISSCQRQKLFYKKNYQIYNNNQMKINFSRPNISPKSSGRYTERSTCDKIIQYQNQIQNNKIDQQSFVLNLNSQYSKNNQNYNSSNIQQSLINLKQNTFGRATLQNMFKIKSKKLSAFNRQ